MKLDKRMKQSELWAETLNSGTVDLEGLGEHIIVDRWICPEDGIGNRDDTRILAAQEGNNGGISRANVLLEVNMSGGEDKGVAFLQDLGDEPVLWVGCHKAYTDLTMQDQQYLSRPRVDVWWHDTFGEVVDSHCWNAKGVEPRDLVHSEAVNAGTINAEVASHVEPTIGEVVSFYLLGVQAREAIDPDGRGASEICNADVL